MARTKLYEVSVTRSIPIYAESEQDAETMAAIITDGDTGEFLVAVCTGESDLSDEELLNLSALDEDIEPTVHTDVH